MNEKYLRGYFETYVSPKRPDATYEQWVSKISSNEDYKKGMFNSHVLPNKKDATYDDWNSKVFGIQQSNGITPDVKKKEQTEPTQAAPLPGLGGVSEEPTPSPSVGQGVLRDVDRTKPRGEAFISRASDLTRTNVREPQVDGEELPTGPTGPTGAIGAMQPREFEGIAVTPTGAAIDLGEQYREEKRVQSERNENIKKYGLDVTKGQLTDVFESPIPEEEDTESYLSKQVGRVTASANNIVNNPKAFGLPADISQMNPNEREEVVDRYIARNYEMRGNGVNMNESELRKVFNQKFDQALAKKKADRDVMLSKESDDELLKAGVSEEGLKPYKLAQIKQRDIASLNPNEKKLYEANVKLQDITSQIKSITSKYEKETGGKLTSRVGGKTLDQRISELNSEGDNLTKLQEKGFTDQASLDAFNKRVDAYNSNLESINKEIESEKIKQDKIQKDYAKDQETLSKMMQEYKSQQEITKSLMSSIGDDRKIMVDYLTGQHVDKLSDDDDADITEAVNAQIVEFNQPTYKDQLDDIYIKVGLRDQRHREYGDNVTDDVTVGTGTTSWFSGAALNRLRSLGYEEVGGVGEVTFKNVPLREQASSYVINVLGDDKRERAERWQATNKQNLIEREALKNMVLLNVDPGKFEKGISFNLFGKKLNLYPSRGVEVLAEELLPSYASVDKAIGFTSDRKLIDAALPLLQEEGIELTKEQERNLERTFGEQATEATFGMIPFIGKVVAVNYMLGPVRALSGFDDLVRVLKYGDGVVKADRVSRLTAGFLEASFEEGAMQVAGAPTGMGFGFSVGGKLFKGIGLDKFPLRPTGEWARSNKALDAFWSHAIKGTSSAEFASVVESMIKDFEGGETFKNFAEENYSDLSDVTQRMLVNAISFSALGVKDLGFFIQKGKSGFNISNMEKARDEAQRKGYKEEADMLTKYINEYYAGKPGKAQPASYNDMKLFVENIPENESRRFTVSSLEEVPVEFRDRAKKNESVETEVDRTFLGIPLGKKKVNSGESYSYEITGKEIRELFNKKKEGKTETEFEEEFDMSQKAEEPPVSEEVTKTEPTVTEPTGDIVPAKQKGRLTKFSTPQDGIVGEVTYEDGTKKELTQEEYDALEKQEGLFDVETGTQPVAETVPAETKEAAPVEKIEKELADDKYELSDENRLNEGGTRFVQEVDGGIIKVAEDDAGIIQNKQEGVESWTPQVIERGYDYVIVEKVNTKENKVLSNFFKDLDALKFNDFKPGSEKIKALSEKYNLTNLDNYIEDVMYGDFVAHEQWGEKNGQIMLVDAGSLVAKPSEAQKGKTQQLDNIESLEISKNEKRDAIQEQAAGEVPVQPEAKAGEKVEEGEPKAEPEVTTQKGKEKEVAPATQGIVSKLLEKVSNSNDDAVTKKRKRAALRAVANILNFKSNILPDTKVKVHETDESYRAATGVDGPGVYDATNDTIHINLAHEEAGDETVYHEMIHPIIYNAVKNETEARILTQRMVEGVVRSSGGNKAIVDKLKGWLEQYEASERPEETIAEVAGFLASEFKNLTLSAKNIIKDYLNRMARRFGGKNLFRAVSKDADVVKVLNRLSEAMRAGEAITAEDLRSGEFEIKTGVEREDSVSMKQRLSSKESISENVGVLNNSISNAIKFASEYSYANNLDFKNALQERFKEDQKEIKKKYGVKSFTEISRIGENKPLKEYLVDAYINETLIALQAYPDALGWYDAKTKAAMSVMSLIHPELSTNKDAESAFKIVLAITSNGNKVFDNFKEANRQYEYFKKNGKFDEKKSIGTQSSGIKSSLKLVNNVLDIIPMSDFSRFLNEKFTVSDLKYKDEKGNTKNLLSGFLANTEVYGASIFGAKIGNGFYMNLNGVFDQLTMDRWFMRQYGRLTGTLIDRSTAKVNNGKIRLKDSISKLSNEEKKTLRSLIPGYSSMNMIDLANSIEKVSAKTDKRKIISEGNLNELRKAGNSLAKDNRGEIEAPKGGSQRAFIIDVFNSVQDRLKNDFGIDITIADLQAVNWYPEKGLYKTFQEGAQESSGKEDVSDNEQPDYETAAIRLAKELGVKESEIKKELNETRRRESDIESVRESVRSGAKELGRTDSKDVKNGIEEIKQSILDVKSGKAQPKVTGKQRKASPEKFVSELEKTKDSDPTQYWSVDSVSLSAAKKGKVISVDGGYGLVSNDGDIKGVFKLPTSKAKGVADNILQEAVNQGGTKLDNFDGYLTKIYERNGFRIAARIPFNEEFAPDGWNKEKHGTPDVVAMVYDPNNELGIKEKKFDDYNAGIEYRDSFLEDKAPAAKKPGVKERKAAAPDQKVRASIDFQNRYGKYFTISKEFNNQKHLDNYISFMERKGNKEVGTETFPIGLKERKPLKFRKPRIKDGLEDSIDDQKKAGIIKRLVDSPGKIIKGTNKQLFDFRGELKDYMRNQEELEYAYYRTINALGSNGVAKLAFDKAYEKIYDGLGPTKRDDLDKIIIARRIISINQSRAFNNLDKIEDLFNSPPKFFTKKGGEYLASFEQTMIDLIDTVSNSPLLKDMIIEEAETLMSMMPVMNSIASNPNLTAKEILSEQNKVIKELKNALDKVLKAENVTFTNNRGVKNGLNEAYELLDSKRNEIGDKVFDELNDRADKYFAKFQEMLDQDLADGIISQEQYDAMTGIEYSPRVFMQTVLDINDDIINSREGSEYIDRMLASNFGMNKDAIKTLRDGIDAKAKPDATDRSFFEMITNSEALLGNYINSRERLRKMNDLSLYMANEISALETKFNTLSNKASLTKEEQMELETIKETLDAFSTKKSTGYLPVRYYENGVKKQFYIRGDLYNQWYNMRPGSLIGDSAVGKVVDKILSSPVAVLKTFATGALSPLFGITASAIDLQQLMIFSDAKGFSEIMPFKAAQIAKDLVGVPFYQKGVIRSIISEDELFTEAVNEGIMMDFLYTQGGMADAAKLIRTGLESAIEKSELGYAGYVRTRKALLKIAEATLILNKVAEIAPRLTAYQRTRDFEYAKIDKMVQQQGLSNEEEEKMRKNARIKAAAIARELMNFSEGGESTKQLDKYSTYLNAAMQGTVTSAREYKKNPIRTTSRMAQSAAMFYGTVIGMATFLVWSLKDDDDDKKVNEIIKETRDNASDYVKQKYFLIPTGRKDRDGNYTSIRLKKHPQLVPFYEMFEIGYDNFLAGDDAVSIVSKENALRINHAFFDNALPMNISPIDKNGNIRSGWDAPKTLAQSNPLIGGGIEAITGYDLYRNRMIEPQTFNSAGTSDAVKGLWNPYTEDFYKSFALEMKDATGTSFSPAQYKHLVERMVTNPRNNLYVAVGYAALNQFNDLDITDKERSFSEDLYDMVSKKVIHSSSSRKGMDKGGVDEFQKELQALDDKEYLVKEAARMAIKDANEKGGFGKLVNETETRKYIVDVQDRFLANMEAVSKKYPDMKFDSNEALSDYIEFIDRNAVLFVNPVGDESSRYKYNDILSVKPGKNKYRKMALSMASAFRNEDIIKKDPLSPEVIDRMIDIVITAENSKKKVGPEFVIEYVKLYNEKNNVNQRSGPVVDAVRSGLRSDSTIVNHQGIRQSLMNW